MFLGCILEFYRGVWVYAVSISAILELVSTFQVSIMLWASPDANPDTACLESKPDGTPSSCVSGTAIVKAWVGIAFFAINITFLTFRIFQLRSWAVTGKYFLRRGRYYMCIRTCAVLELCNVIYFFCLWFLTHEDPRIRIGVIVPLAYNGIFCTIELCMGEKFRVFMADVKINQATDFFLSADSTEHASSSASPGQPNSKEQSAPAWKPPQEFEKAVLHWSKVSVDVPTDKALWMTMDDNNGNVAGFVQNLLSPPNNNAYTRIALVDVSQTRSTLWPLIRGLLSASPQYKEEIAKNPPTPLYEYFRRFPWRPSFRIDEELNGSPLNDSDTADRMISRLISTPLQRAHEHLNKKGPSHRRDREWAKLSLMPVALIIHGVRNTDQAEELYELIRTFKRGGHEYSYKEYYKHIAIVVISSPEVFRHLSYNHAEILTYTFTLYTSDSGAIIYSGNHYSSPRLEEELSKRLIDGIHRTPGVESERLLSRYTQLGLLSAPQMEDVSSGGPSTQSILKKLHELSEARIQILQGLSEIENIPDFRQNDTTLLMNNVDKLNNVQTAEMLQQLFLFNSYKEVIPNMDAKYASAALNLTTTMLAGDLPARITNQTEFTRLAERFRNWVARHLNQLPDELSISNIVQASEYPLQGGGFADVYRGRYKDPANGAQIEVALKVLRIFENPTEESIASLGKFVKEALVWHGLKHKNILPFLGVDYITFTPRWAMVSPWMPLGSVPDHMGKNLLSSRDAIQLLNGVIQGLTYLHSKNIVHGDLCRRNILLDRDGTPRLADFGLTDFIENETSIKSKSTKRAGSTRWMAPELLVVRQGVRFRRTPASDVWAFGCVCGEILSGGTPPFNQYGEPNIFIAMSQEEQIIPYPDKPVKSATDLVPEQLWQLTHRCFHYNPSERPAAETLREEFSTIHQIPQDAAQEAADTDATASNTSQTPPVSSPTAAAVRFGPIEIARTPEETFSVIFERLSRHPNVRTGVLVEPVSVENDADSHVLLHFRTPVEANSFTLTWMAHRFEPYLEVDATW